MRSDLKDLKAELAQLAADHGFALFGITHAGPHPEQIHFSSWLKNGYAASMDYINRRANERLDLQQYFPGAKSVLCFGMHYAQNSREPSSQLPKIAAYARGRDYHSFMKKRLLKIAAFLEKKTNCKTRICVDTSPILERIYSFHAGLGWIGKNTCLINKKQGSFFLLGEIVTDLSFPDDQTATNHCGSCRKCLDACPTDAFPEPYVLDARKCISYWTIEHRGSIPDELKSKIGEHLFGCDVCQEVCPWNHDPIKINVDPVFSEKYSPTQRLEQIMESNSDSFRTLFEGSPLKRSRWQGLIRNAAIVIGNLNLHRYQNGLNRASRSSASTQPDLKQDIDWSLDRLEKNSKGTRT